MTSVQLIRTHKFRIPMNTGSLKLNVLGQIFVRGEKLASLYTSSFQQKSSITIVERTTGREVKTTMSACKHRYSHRMVEHPREPNVILEACMDCQVIRAYDIFVAEVTTLNEGYSFKLLCLRPDCRRLAADNDGTIFDLMWQEGAKYFEVRHLFETNNRSISAMSYDKKLDILAIISHLPNCIHGIRLRDGSSLWRISGQVLGQYIMSSGLCWDTDGRIYVADTTRVLVVNGQTGEVLQILLETPNDGMNTDPKTKDMDRHGGENFQPISDVCFCPIESELVMLHGNIATDLTISCFKKVDNG